MRLAVRFVVVLAAWLVFTQSVSAALRFPYEDADVVARSELIVVARLKADSVKYVAHKPPNPDDGRSWEHHATLVITEVIKGDAKAAELPVVLHYGIDPVVGGILQREGLRIDVRHGGKDYPPGRIELRDTGNSSFSLTPLVEDAAQDHLWFLRRGLGGELAGNRDALGIIDPEDVQPLALRSYFERYRSAGPEAAIRRYIKETPEPRDSARRYLDHLEVQRIAALPDVNERAERLLPYFLRDARWGLTDEAGDALVKCGEAGGDRLLQVFDRPEHARSRVRIIRIWEALRHRRAVPVLVRLLERHDKFFAEQEDKLKPGWWNDDKDPQRSRRQEASGEVYYGVAALGWIGDPAARDMIERTRTRWKRIKSENSQIVEACDDAIARLASHEPGL